jgi:hypothetical protein
MYNAINQQYNDSTFYIAVLGRGHVLPKDKQTVKKPQNKFKNATALLRTDKNSHFKRHIITLVFCPLTRSSTIINMENEAKTLHNQYPYPDRFTRHKDYLNALLTTGNSTLINLRETKLRYLRRDADYMIVIKNATGI